MVSPARPAAGRLRDRAEDIRTRVERAKASKSLVLCEQPMTVLKSEIYRLVDEWGNKQWTLSKLSRLLVSSGPAWGRETDNHYALAFRLIDAGRSAPLLKKQTRSRFVQELTLAEEYQIDVECLCFFLAVLPSRLAHKGGLGRSPRWLYPLTREAQIGDRSA